MKKRILSLALALVLLVTMVPSVFATNDQPSGWATGYVNEAVAAGLVPQHLRTRFTDSITRAEFTHLGVALYEAATGRTITGRTTFTDTNDVNVQKMAYLGVVNGVGGGRFNPDGLLTRQEAAAMLSRLYAVVDEALASHTPTFADNNAIANWARAYVGQMQASGIMGGTGNNNFSPGGRYTIEQSIITMLRVYNIIALNHFTQGMNLGLIREALGVDFTIGTDEGAFPQQLWSWRSLNLGPGFDVFTDLDFALSYSFHGNVFNSQTGDVILWRNGDTETFWVQIDIGNALELYLENGWTVPEWMDAGHRAYHSVLQASLAR